jgi:hypothetical protein
LQNQTTDGLAGLVSTWRPDRDWQALKSEQEHSKRHLERMYKAGAVLFVLILALIAASLTKYRAALAASGWTTIVHIIWASALILWFVLIMTFTGLRLPLEGGLEHAEKLPLRRRLTLIVAVAIFCLWVSDLTIFYIAHTK